MYSTFGIRWFVDYKNRILQAINLAQMKNEKNCTPAIYGLFILMTACCCSPRPDGGQSTAEQAAAEETRSANRAAEPEEEAYPEFPAGTSKDYAFVFKPDAGLVAVNKAGETLYQVFLYDNGPDYPSDGYFRIVKNGKIGYADEETGAVRIKPQYAAAYPFVNGYAPVCPDCVTEEDGEYSRWVNGKWGLIDKEGRVALRPEFEEILEVGKDGRALVAVNGGQKWVRIE